MSKIGPAGWIFLYVATGIIDLVQWLVGIFEVPLTAIGIGAVVAAINGAADPIIGILLAGYFQIRGVSLISHPSRLVSLLGFAGLGAITGGIASFWIIDIWYIHRTVKADDAARKSAQMQSEMSNLQSQALYTSDENGNGVRLPKSARSGSDSPLNSDGYSRPRS